MQLATMLVCQKPKMAHMLFYQNISFIKLTGFIEIQVENLREIGNGTKGYLVGCVVRVLSHKD